MAPRLGGSVGMTSELLMMAAPVSDSCVHMNVKDLVFLLHSGLFVHEALCVHVRGFLLSELLSGFVDNELPSRRSGTTTLPSHRADSAALFPSLLFFF